jgi:hypothetical protein
MSTPQHKTQFGVETSSQFFIHTQPAIVRFHHQVLCSVRVTYAGSCSSSHFTPPPIPRRFFDGRRRFDGWLGTANHQADTRSRVVV